MTAENDNSIARQGKAWRWRSLHRGALESGRTTGSPTRAMVLRLLAVVAGIAVRSCGGLVEREPGRQFMTFAAEAWGEVKKVVWPTRKETIQTTAAVFAFVVVMAVFLWISDKTLEWVLYDLLLGWKKT